MLIKLKTNEQSEQEGRVPFYDNWEAVVSSSFGDVQSLFADEMFAIAGICMEGKNMTDYFVRVQPVNVIPGELEDTYENVGTPIWVRHTFLVQPDDSPINM